MARLTAAHSAAILRDREARARVRFVDMAVSLRICDVDTTSGPDPVWVTETDEELVELGGLWDRRAKRWAGEAASVRIVRVPRGSDQELPARWLAVWFARTARGGRGDHWTVPVTIAMGAPPREGSWTRRTDAPISVEFRRVWTLMLVGGRRGGKSHLAVFALIAMALLVPRSRLIAISPTQDETEELDVAAREIMPREWFTEHAGKTNKTVTFRFMNSSSLKFISGHKPRGLKRGRIDLALYNEGQDMSKAGWSKLLGAIADIGGLVIIACNPPDEEIGRWIEDMYAKIRARAIAAESFHFVGKNNPFVTEEVLADMRRDLDDVTARKDVDGEMGVPIGDVVFHAWTDGETIRPVPAGFIDITAEVTRRELGRAAGYVVGMDFQKTPHMAAAIYKLFRDPLDPGEVLAWLVDEVVVEDANEGELCDALEALDRWTPTGRVAGETYRGWIEPGDDPATPVHCVQVIDASAWWQDGEHHKGQKSDRLLAERRWAFNYRPQKESKDNPRVKERTKVTNARLKTATPENKRRLFSLPHNLKINLAMRTWKNHHITGAPDKNSEPAHCCDAATYPIYRLFGAAKRSSGGYVSGGKYSRAAELRGL